MFKSSIFCIAASVASYPITAQSTDYLGHMEQFEFAAQMNTSVASCGHFGMSVNGKGVADYSKRLIADAIRDGVPASVANTLFLHALNDERKRQDAVLHDLQLAAPDVAESRLQTFIQSWEVRCFKLATDPRSSPYFKSVKP